MPKVSWGARHAIVMPCKDVSTCGGYRQLLLSWHTNARAAVLCDLSVGPVVDAVASEDAMYLPYCTDVACRHNFNYRIYDHCPHTEKYGQSCP